MGDFVEEGATFAEIAEEYERIKEKPDAIDKQRVSENHIGGKSADDLAKRQQHLPSDEEHAKLADHYSNMFDKTKRSGPRSSLHGLVLPSGRENFKNFHDNYTGTGRIAKKDPVRPTEQRANAPKVDTHQNIAMLYERCVDCRQPVDKEECIPNMSIIPPFEAITPEEKAKWTVLNLKPGFWICYLFCTACFQKAAEEVRATRNDPVLNSVLIPNPAGGPPISLAEQAAVKVAKQRSARISENVHEMLLKERDNPDSKCFYGDARIEKGS